jgi:DNA-dependent metalloprotease WSS1
MLFRIAREFQPIMMRRNYNVLSISEMCCCGDGLDHEPTAANNNGKRRKRRIMSHNILGYNMTNFSSSGGGRRSSRIHIRLRHPADHCKFYDYEDVAGTLAHELAHCEHSKHDAKFFKLMDEILDEHAALLTSALRHNGAPMATFGGQGQRLSSSGDPAAADATPSSSSSWFGGNGNRLGGGGGGRNNDDSKKNDSRLVPRGYRLGGDSIFCIYMTPAEAAVAAAEARRRQQQLRLRGDSWCNPCVIDMSNDDDDDDEDAIIVSGNDDDAATTKPAAKRKPPPILVPQQNKNKNDGEHRPPLQPRGAGAATTTTTTTTTTTCIDLTNDDDDSSKPPAKVADGSTNVAAKDHHHGREEQLQQLWHCRRCTFANGPIALACAMCAAERNYRPSS